MDPRLLNDVAPEAPKAPPEPLIACRNVKCTMIPKLSDSRRVTQYRYCKPCYDLMLKIGQIIEHPEKRGSGEMQLMWEGDPFNRHLSGPFNVPQQRLRPPGAWED